MVIPGELSPENRSQPPRPSSRTPRCFTTVFLQARTLSLSLSTRNKCLSVAAPPFCVEQGAEGGPGGLEAAAYDVLDDSGGGMDTMTAGGDIRNCWDEDVVDFEEDEEDDDDDDDDSSTAGGGGGRGGGEKTSAAGPGRAAAWTEKTQDGDDGHSAAAYSSPDFAGGEFCGDLVDQMSELHPEEKIEFKMDDTDFGFFDDGGFRPGGDAAGGHYHNSLSRRNVYADLVMPYGDPHGHGGQGILSIPVKISVQETDDDDEDD